MAAGPPADADGDRRLGRRGRGRRALQDARRDGRPYTIQEQVVELDEERYETPESAVEAFVAACEKLVELALSRDPTVAAWKPEIPERSAARRRSY